jgi:hypothetical protein
VKNRKALGVCGAEDYRGPWLLSLPGGAGSSASATLKSGCLATPTQPR